MGKAIVSIIGENGASLPGAKHNGQIYVGGNSGQKYKIRISNTTGRRILAVVTVDGRSVISGELGDYSGRGYVLMPHGHTDIDGWRQTDETVATFTFGDKANSYAALGGSGENVGIIGVAIFEERTHPASILGGYIPNGSYDPVRIVPGWTPVHPGPTYSSSGISLCGGLYSSTMDSVVTNPKEEAGAQELGTAYGETVKSTILKVDFIRATENPCEIHEISYDSIEALENAGILGQRPSETKKPKAFPNEPAVTAGYCAPPKITR